MLVLWYWIRSAIPRTKLSKRTVNWNACNRRTVSSTERPTGKSLTVICLETMSHFEHPRNTNGVLAIPDNALGIDEEQATERNTLFLDENIVITRDLHVSVGNQRKFQVRPEATLLPRLLSPSKVRVLGIRRDACDV